MTAFSRVIASEMLPDSYSLHSLLIQGPMARGAVGGFRNTRRLGPQGRDSPLSSAVKWSFAGTLGTVLLLLCGSRSMAPISSMAATMIFSGMYQSPRNGWDSLVA